MSTTTEADQHLRRIATPTRLGKWLVEGEPQIWGHEQTYEVDPWLLHVEGRVLDAIVDQKKQRFIRVHVPPQVGKTTFSGFFLPFWVLGMFPNTRIIFITYSDSLAAERGKALRDYVKTYGKALFGIEIDPSRDSATDWGLKGHRGGMLSAGIGSGITGRPGDLIIIDDLIKNIIEASSVATKRGHIRDYLGTVRSRLQPGGTILMTATRWADDDLGGWLEERMRQPGYRGDQWESISIPAIAELPNHISPADVDVDTWVDDIGRKIGEPLQCRFTDPNLPWDETTFYQLRRTSDEPFIFDCLYQQNPTSRTGGMFPQDKWKRYKRAELPPMVDKVRVWDTAATEGGGDWSTGTLMGKDTNGNFYVLDVVRVQMSSDRVLDHAKMVGTIDGYDIQILIEEERAGGGKSVVTFWKKELPQFRVRGVRPDGTKEDRATPWSTILHSGRAYIPEDAEGLDWVSELIDQHRKMMGDGRRGKHDDIVDTCAYGVLELLGSSTVELWDPLSMTPHAEVAMEDLLMKQVLGL